jgi:hypothetical protein
VRRYRFTIVLERESRSPQETSALLRRRLQLLEGCDVRGIQAVACDVLPDVLPDPLPDPLALEPLSPMVPERGRDLGTLCDGMGV